MIHYALSISEENFPLIAFLNGGKLPSGIIETENSPKMWYFCFSIDPDKNTIKVLKRPIREFYSLWKDENSTKNNRHLI